MPARSDLTGVTLDHSFAEKRITADYIVEALREAINAGEIEDGALLSQADLATHFKVSRVPVREALRQLQAEGLVDLRAHQLAAVTGLTPDRLNEVYLLRSVLESWLLRTAAPRLLPEHFARARKINERLRLEGNHAAMLKLNTDFHAVLYEPSSLSLTLEYLTHLRARSERYAQMWSRGVDSSRPLEAADEHEAMLQMLERGEVDAAVAAVSDHVLHTRDSVLRTGGYAELTPS